MGMHAGTSRLVDAARQVLEGHNPMTVRQVYYQLISKPELELPNEHKIYLKVARILRDARWKGLIPWAHIEDRLRQPRDVSMWEDVHDLTQWAAGVYRRNVWSTQPQYLEVVVEKDALSGIFADLLDPYGVTLNVGRGYSSTSSIRDMALRYNESLRPVVIQYYGDFDPSGEDMPRALQATLNRFECHIEIVKCALTESDIQTYSLPRDPSKIKDKRSGAFIAKHGEFSSTELDALPLNVLRQRIIQEVKSRMDLDALQKVKEQEEADRIKLVERLRDVA